MKTIIISILLAATYLSSYAQDQRLFQNDWYLNKVTLDGVDYPAPHNSEIEFVTLLIRPEPDGFDTEICNILDASDVVITNTDINANELILLLNEPCNMQENNDYESLYFGFFANNPANQIFHYTYAIEEFEGHFQLTLINDEGNQAIYGDQPLGVPDHTEVKIALYPNPVWDMFAIQSTEPIERVVLYNVLGKELLTVTHDFQQIDMSSLPKGVYFASITTAKGNMVRKVVKD